MDSGIGLELGRSLSTSSSLIRGAKAGEGVSWKRLVSLYSPLIYGWCRDSRLPPADAADVVQEVFLAVWRGRDGFARQEAGHSFRGWLRVIVQNKIADHFRVESVRLPAEGLVGDLEEPAAPRDGSTATGIERRHFRQLLDRALETIRGEFKPGTWQAFQLSVLQGRSTAEIARDLGIRVTAVRQAKYRVLRRLRAELGEGDW